MRNELNAGELCALLCFERALGGRTERQSPRASSRAVLLPACIRGWRSYAIIIKLLW